MLRAFKVLVIGMLTLADEININFESDVAISRRQKGKNFTERCKFN